MRKPIIALVLGLMAVSAAASAQSAAPAYIKAAVNDPGRSEMMRARDAARKPAALLAFSGIKPGDRVGDLIPGGSYFTGLFSLVVGPKGHVYSICPEEHVKVDDDTPKGTK